jgi:hypothetical protein
MFQEFVLSGEDMFRIRMFRIATVGTEPKILWEKNRLVPEQVGCIFECMSTAETARVHAQLAFVIRRECACFLFL